MECSPLGEPCKVGCLFPTKGGDPADKKFSAGSIGQVKLKLDTPEKPPLHLTFSELSLSCSSTGTSVQIILCNDKGI